MVTLTKAEERIMQILWDIEKGFIKDIQEHFPKPIPPYNTISTIVRVLVKKEIVSFKSYGGSYQYFPLISKDDYRKDQMGRLVNNYFGNSLSEVVSFLSEKKDLDVDELNEALSMLEELKRAKGK
ncbi:MAG: BlaI/MecI/CopY family transcriptional regulator [Bacteroidales bacterium]|jgi:BlaI family penicillinase repressor|nr:BlaI/MecI/CopY family transcriptional regulator [Bacteroidales bacterium]